MENPTASVENKLDGDEILDAHKVDKAEQEVKKDNISVAVPETDEGQNGVVEKLDESRKVELATCEEEMLDVQLEDKTEQPKEVEAVLKSEESPEVNGTTGQDELMNKMEASCVLEPETHEETKKTAEEKQVDPVFDGTEVPGVEANASASTRSLDTAPEAQGYDWPEKAVALKNFVKEKSNVAASVLRRLSGKGLEGGEVDADGDRKNDNDRSPGKEGASSPTIETTEDKEVSAKPAERSSWNPLSYIGFSRDVGAENKVEQVIPEAAQPLEMKGRIILYTRLGCQDCKEARLFLHYKRLSYVEINIDVYPSRKQELEKISGSSAVPMVMFNEVLIGGLSELKALDESGKLNEKIDHLISEAPPLEAPLPPLPSDDDVYNSETTDDLAVVVRKMREFIAIKDRFYKMRWFTNCFLGSEAVDFISEDQHLEREEAIEFGRNLASKLFFQHVLDENLFEDGSHAYRLLDQDPLVASQCQNIPRGILEVKPKAITEIASRLRFLSYAIFEAYTSQDGKHIDYRSISGSEEFARYLRTVEELQRVNLQDMSREEKLAFFINLHNMMAIHAILVWGHPNGALERRKLFGDFKYVVGGCAYSLSAIQNGILRANQRPPYNLIKPFGAKDRRFKVALPSPEPLIHFALVWGSRVGPALRCYSPGNIDKELTEAARNFVGSGGLIIDISAKVAYLSMIFKWEDIVSLERFKELHKHGIGFLGALDQSLALKALMEEDFLLKTWIIRFSVDFGKNEVEVLKYAANYLEPAESQALLELLASTQLKVIYQPYDWGLNL